MTVVREPMTECPRCKKRITELSMELCDMFRDERQVMEHYYCHCPSCQHTFYLNKYYTYATEVVERV